jgi:hypothetical protein
MKRVPGYTIPMHLGSYGSYAPCRYWRSTPAGRRLVDDRAQRLRTVRAQRSRAFRRAAARDGGPRPRLGSCHGNAFRLIPHHETFTTIPPPYSSTKGPRPRLGSWAAGRCCGRRPSRGRPAAWRRRVACGEKRGEVPYYTASHTHPHTTLHLNNNRDVLRQRK